jgi:hypothetical protein
MNGCKSGGEDACEYKSRFASTLSGVVLSATDKTPERKSEEIPSQRLRVATGNEP